MVSRIARLAGVLALLTFAPVAPALAAAPFPATFADPSSLTSPKGFNVVAADFNGDNHPDLATTSYDQSPTVSVLLTNANGTFKPAVTYPVAERPNSIAMGEFNGDGHPDLVTANYGYGCDTVSVLLGHADGTFATPVNYTLPNNFCAHDVAVAQVTSDANPDLVVTDYAHGSVAVLAGSASGSFGSPTSYPVGDYPTAVAAEDFNGDGRADLAVVNSAWGNDPTSKVSVLLAQAAGGFAPPATYIVGWGAEAIAAKDLNGDGHPDLVTSNSSDHTISVLLGQAGGTFAGQVTYPIGGGAGIVSNRDVRIADLNGDGKPDVAAAVSNSGVSMLLGKGDGTFTPAVTLSGGAPLGLAIADMDGNGQPDVVSADGSGPGLTVHLNTTAGSVASAAAATDKRALPVSYTATGQAMDKVRLYVKTPGASTYTLAAEKSAPGTSGQFAYTVGAGDGSYEFYTALVDAAGNEESTPATADVTTQVTLARSVAPESPVFDPQTVGTSSAPYEARVVNSGEAALTVHSPAVVGTDLGDFAIVSDECSGVALAPGDSCALRVRFTPSAIGARSARIIFQADSLTGSLNLSGEGIAGPPAAVQPSATPAPAPTPIIAAPKKLTASLAYTYSQNKSGTKLRTLVVKGFPKGATIVARCAKGCAKKSFTKTNASATISLKALIGKPLKVGTVITVTVTKPGMTQVVKTLKIRARKAPLITTR